MKVLINNEEIMMDEGCAPQEAIGQLLKELRGRDMIILETKVNGVKFNALKAENDLIQLAGMNDIESIEITAGTPGQIVFEGLETSLQYLPVLKSGLSDIASLFQEGREGEGINKFLEASNGMDWLGQILSGATSYLPSESREQFARLYKGYSSRLAELMQAWENLDYVLIGDLLEYEMIPFLEEVLETVNDVTKSMV